MNDGQTPAERLRDLLARRALEGLDPDDADALRALGGDADDADDLVVGAVDAAFYRSGVPTELPEGLAARIAADAPVHLPAPPIIGTATTRRPRLFAWSGWAAAAAASAALAYTLNRPPERVEVRVPVVVEAAAASAPAPAPPAEPTPEEALAAFRGEAASAALAASASPLASGASGEVVWSDRRRGGFLRVDGLAPVDPAKGVYQLWIFDRRRDPRYPVDGGTFAVAEAGPTVVPIRPAVAVAEPTLFAVTLEPPGGVVVSDRKRIVLAGAWPG